MLLGVWQLTKLMLTTDSRRTGLHAIRFGLVIALYLAVLYSSLFSSSSAVGLPIFQSQVAITAFFLSMTSMFGFSQAISEEKEDETLGLIRLADIGPMSIILGKLAAILCDAALLILIQIPFTLASITLGGVSWAQVYAAYVALIAYLWLLATLGIAASVVCSTGAKAARWMAYFLVAYAVPPCIRLFTAWGWGLFSSTYRYFSLTTRLVDITDSSFDESPWCLAVGIAFCLGWLCLFVSWLAFDRIEVGEIAISRVAVLKSRSRQSLRSWSNPIVWREYTFLMGGVSWTILRIVAHFLIVVAVFFSTSGIGLWLAWSSIWCGLLSLVDGMWSASRLFGSEIRDRTWSSLVQTPSTVSQLYLGKVCGWALGLAPSILIPYGLILGMITLHEHINDFLNRLEVVIGSLTIGVSIFGYLHLLVLVSLYFGWKATPMALTICVAAGWLYVYSVFSVAHSIEVRCAVFCFTCVVIFGLMLFIQLFTLRRLTELAQSA